MADAIAPAAEAPAPELPTVRSLEQFKALKGGDPYLDPMGNKLTREYEITGKTPDEIKSSYEAIPEGADYFTPEGMKRTKPVNEGLDLTSQTLYDMARTDGERRKVLERIYGPSAVQGDGKDAYVVDPENPKRRLKPGGGSTAKRATATVLSEAAPVGGAVIGEIAGAAAGTAAEPGVGTFVGATAGAAVGSAAGQAFNDMALKLAGVHDRSAGDEVRDVASAGLVGAAGTAAGRVAAAGAPVAKEAAGAAMRLAPRAFAKIAGATPEGVSQAARLASDGTLVPPSSWLPELPYVHKVVEAFDPQFRKQEPLKQSAQRYYEDKAGGVLADLGITDHEPLTGATAKVTSERAGQMTIDRVRSGIAAEDQKLESAAQAAKEAAAKRYMGEAAESEKTQAKALEALAVAEQSNRQMAQDAIDHGFNMIRADADAAVKAVGAGENAGDMVRQFATKIQTLRAAIGQRAKILYEAADKAAPLARPDVAELKSAATEFLESLPEPFKQKHPAIVKQLSNMEQGSTTFGQLHNLRSMLRQDLDYTDLTPSIRDGVYSKFAKMTDGVLKAGLQDGAESPELKKAYELLQKADSFYAKNMPRFQDEKVRGIVEATKAGMPMDPALLAREVFQPGYTERMGELRKIAGKPLWSAIQAADTKSMVEQSRTLAPGKIDGLAFAKQVEDRYKTGILEAGYDKATADKLMLQAQRVLAAEGKLPVDALPGDTVTSLLRKADNYLAEADKLSKVDPLGMLKSETERLKDEHRAGVMALKRQRGEDPLNFLFKANAGPIKAADKILASPDLMMAAATKFGEDSAEFTALRQVYAHRLLQRSTGQATKLMDDIQKITPEVQALVFPGVSLDNAKRIAKDMEFLRMADDPGGGSSIAANTRVLHPLGEMSKGDLKSLATNIPGANAVGRIVLGNYYKLITYGATHPVFINWVARGLQGGPAERETVRSAVQRVLSGSGGVGGAAGAGGAEALYQDAQQP